MHLNERTTHPKKSNPQGFKDDRGVVRAKQKKSASQETQSSYEPAYLQAKLAVAPASDPLELQADALADKIASVPFKSQRDSKSSSEPNLKTPPSIDPLKSLNTVQRKAKSTDSVGHGVVDNSKASQTAIHKNTTEDEQIHRSPDSQSTIFEPKKGTSLRPSTAIGILKFSLDIITYLAPLESNTAGIVFNKILISNQSVQLSIYSKSISTHSSKLVIWFLPPACQVHVIPGFTLNLRR